MGGESIVLHAMHGSRYCGACGVDAGLHEGRRQGSGDDCSCRQVLGGRVGAKDCWGAREIELHGHNRRRAHVGVDGNVHAAVLADAAAAVAGGGGGVCRCSHCMGDAAAE